jgi:crotonobetainyl-CoA:carnitine CoA-transferase CaiB-like acyl-CoA transferase
MSPVMQNLAENAHWKRRLPLADIRVLDLADEKGSFCSKILADLGACVIKVERPGGDASRGVGPFSSIPPQNSTSLSFAYNNTNKLGITLSLKHEQGRELFLRLIRRSDVLVESFPPGFLDELGLGCEILTTENKELILASITGFGQSGPRMGFKSCDLVAAAMGGQMYICGAPSAAPLKAFGEQSFFAASLYAAVGILLALRKRATSGRGDRIDISLQESVVSTLEHVMLRYFHGQVVSGRRRDRHWSDSFCVLKCRDGYIHMTPFMKWETLVGLLDREGMAEDLKDEEWRNEDYRSKNADHVLDVLQKWTKRHCVSELFELGQLLRLPWAPVESPAQILKNPQLKARNFFSASAQAGSVGISGHAGSPYKFSSVQLPGPTPAPLPGQHNVRIYEQELGLSREELEKLSSIGAI